MLATFVHRLVLTALAATACWTLANRFGIWHAAWIWAVASAGSCVARALLLRISPLGRIGWQNRVASHLVPWGARLSRGALWPIPVVSWVVWMVIGAAVFCLMPGEVQPPHASNIRRVLLFAAWMVDGAALLYLLGTIRQNFPPGSGGRRRLGKFVLALLILLGGSLALFVGGSMGLALLLAGGPPLVLGTGYGLFVVTLLLLGRNARWN